MLDANAMLEKQDLTIARMVIEEGRALVIAANKWDIVGIGTRLWASPRPFADLTTAGEGVPYITISAERGRNLDTLLRSHRTYDIWNRRVSTSRLNRWLADMIGRHPPPLARGAG